MAIAINGAGTITGVSVGGLPDGCIAEADIASGVIPAGGKVLQVVSTVKQDTFTASPATYTTITGLTATITPSATTSKILATYCVFGSPSGTANTLNTALFRDSAQVGGGTAVSNRPSTSGNISSYASTTSAAEVVSFTYLDSPSSTSALVYTVRVKLPNASGYSVYINMVHGDDNTVYSARGSSTITLMEIGA